MNNGDFASGCACGGRGWPERLLSTSLHKWPKKRGKKSVRNLCHLNVGIIKLNLCTPTFLLSHFPTPCQNDKTSYDVKPNGDEPRCCPSFSRGAYRVRRGVTRGRFHKFWAVLLLRENYMYLQQIIKNQKWDMIRGPNRRTPGCGDGKHGDIY